MEEVVETATAVAIESAGGETKSMEELFPNISGKVRLNIIMKVYAVPDEAYPASHSMV